MVQLILTGFVAFVTTISSGMGQKPENCLEEAHPICTSGDSLFPNPDNCNQYFHCVMETKLECGKPYLGYTIHSCTSDMFYNGILGECVDSFYCPWDPEITKPCKINNEKYGLPNKCRKHTVCVLQGTQGQWEERDCNTNQHFDAEIKDCVPGACPNCFPIAPFFADCSIHGERHRFPHPYDCTKFFVCKSNMDECDEGSWGRIEHNCPSGQYFDPMNMTCVSAEKCPQICPTSVCRPELTADCRSMSGCRPVKTCPANCFKQFYTVDNAYTVKCTGTDEFYDLAGGMCVKALACPANQTEENCPLRWDFMATKGWQGNMFMDNETFCRSYVNGQYQYGLFYGNPGICYTQATRSYKYLEKSDKYELLSVENIRLNIFKELPKKQGILPTSASYAEKSHFFAVYIECDTCKPKPGVFILGGATMHTFEESLKRKDSCRHDNWYIFQCNIQ